MEQIGSHIVFTEELEKAKIAERMLVVDKNMYSLTAIVDLIL